MSEIVAASPDVPATPSTPSAAPPTPEVPTARARVASSDATTNDSASSARAEPVAPSPGVRVSVDVDQGAYVAGDTVSGVVEVECDGPVKAKVRANAQSRARQI